MELNHRAFFRDQGGNMFDFLLERREIGDGDALVLLDRDVACAEKAEALAERKMHVKRQRGCEPVCAHVGFLEIGGAKIVLPYRRRGIARVARTGPIVFFEQFFRNSTDFELLAGLCFHFAHLRAAAIAFLPASTNARALSTGVVGKMPWPRFRTWPVAPGFFGRPEQL